MKKVSFEGFDAKYLTFRAAENSNFKKGDFVELDNNGCVKAASAGEITGKCVDINGELVTVQVSGYMTGKMADNIFFAPGRRHISLNSSGKLELNSSADSVLVTFTDTDNATVGFIL